MTNRKYEVLRILAGVSWPLSAAQIALKLHLPHGSIVAALDALIEAGLVLIQVEEPNLHVYCIEAENGRKALAKEREKRESDAR